MFVGSVTRAPVRMRNLDGKTVECVPQEPTHLIGRVSAGEAGCGLGSLTYRQVMRGPSERERHFLCHLGTRTTYAQPAVLMKRPGYCKPPTKQCRFMETFQSGRKICCHSPCVQFRLNTCPGIAERLMPWLWMALI